MSFHILPGRKTASSQPLSRTFSQPPASQLANLSARHPAIHQPASSSASQLHIQPAAIYLAPKPLSKPPASHLHYFALTLTGPDCSLRININSRGPRSLSLIFNCPISVWCPNTSLISVIIHSSFLFTSDFLVF